MKRGTILTVSIIVIVIAVTTGPPRLAGAVIEGRYQWWQVRHQKLADEKARIQKEGRSDPRLLPVIDGEMARARELVDVFERALVDSGSLTGVTRVWSAAETEREIDAQFGPLFSLYYLDALAGDDGIRSADAVGVAKAAVRPLVDGLVMEIFETRDADCSARIMAQDLSERQWRDLALEIAVGRFMTAMPAVKAAVRSRVIESVNRRLADAGGSVHARALRQMITAAALEELRGMEPRLVRAAPGAAVDAAWTWREVRARLRREITHARAIASIPGAPAKLKPARVRELGRNPAELERLLFPAPQPIPKAMHDGAAGDEENLAIPPQPDPRGVHEELARLRKKALSAVTGRETEDWFTELDQRAAIAVRRHCDDASAAFFRERERRTVGTHFANEEAFRGAESRYGETRAAMEADARRTAAFARWLSAGRRREAGPVLEDYTYRIDRSRAYLAFARDCGREAVGAAGIDAPGIYQRLVMAVRKTDPLFSLAGTALTIERADMSALGKAELTWSREIRGKALVNITELHHQLARDCERFTAVVKERGAKARVTRGRLDGTVVQHEITLLQRNAEAWADLAAGFRYAEEAFANYCARYRVFEEEARSGAASPELEEVLRRRSLLAKMQGFDRDRLAREVAARQYARREGDAALSRLVTLLGAYRRQGMRIVDAPGAVELQAVREKLGASLDVTVADWRMGESTVDEVDRKAVEKLVNLYRRAAWTRGRSPAAENSDEAAGPRPATVTIPVALKDAGIVFELPAGWEARKIGEVERMRGVISSYAPGDGSALVRVVRVPLERETPGAVTEHWLRRGGNEIMEKRIIRRDGGAIFWTRSRDRSRNVVEASTVVRNGTAYIVSAKTAKQHYGRFKDQFDGLVNSLQP